MAKRAGKSGGVAAAVLLALALCVCVWRERPRALRDSDAPVVEVSAVRAAEAWDSLPGAQAPHPLGSATHDELAEALAERLRALGLDVRVEDALGAGLHGTVARTRNIVALLRGSGPADAPLLALSSHYDSTPSGPGASDAGLGCAALLETARALAARARSRAPLPHDVLFLFTDGEEVDLCGAADWARRDPLARRTGLLVNFEARGTQGLLRIFRASGPQAELAAFVARAAPRPSTSSFAVEVFRLLPNDTDVSVHAAAGISALDAACIGGVARYHTPLDDAQHRDAGTLQHACDTALAMALEWRGEGAGSKSSSRLDSAPADGGSAPEDAPRAWWSDVLGLLVLLAPAWSAAPLALLALVLCLRRGAGRSAALWGSAAGALGGALLATLVCALLAALAAWRHGAPDFWSAHPWAARAGVAGSAFACGLGLVRASAPRTDGKPRVRTAGATLALSGVALGIALWSGAAAVPLLLPALVAALALALLPPAGALLAAPLGLILLVPLLFGIEEAFGYGLVSALAVPWALLGALAAGASGGGTAWLAVGLGALGWIAAFVLPAHDADAPRHANVHLWSANGSAWSLVDGAATEADATPRPPDAPDWLPEGAWRALPEGALADRLRASAPGRVATRNGTEWTLETTPGLAQWRIEASAGARVKEVRFSGSSIAIEGDGALRLHGDFGSGFVLVLDRPAPSLEVREARLLSPPLVDDLRPAGCVPVGTGDRLWRLHLGRF